MPALAHHRSPAPGPQAPPLQAVAVPDAPAAPRLSAWDLARFAAGLAAGFLLAAVASAPGGGAIVTGQLALAAVAAVVAAAAAWRSRVTARPERRPHSG